MQNRLYKKVLAYLREQNMLQRGDSVLAAVSGGADSMCLLHLLHEMSRKQGFFLTAATFDHQIRAEGASDAAFVEKWCEKEGIPCVKGRGNVPQYAKEHRLGLEEAARILRYDFLRRTAKERNCQRIATAHNAGDNAETILLHLIRGSGLKGLSGIHPVQKDVIRPILCCERWEIEDYLREKDIPHVEDATNADTTYSRSYLRHEVLPLLMEKNPSLLTGLLRSGESLRADEEYLSAEAEKIAAEGTLSGGQVIFSAERCRRLPDALFNRVIQKWAERLSTETVLTAENRKAVRELCRQECPSASVCLTGGLIARREYDSVILEPAAGQKRPETVFLAPGEQTEFGGRAFHCEWAECPAGKFNQPHTYYLKAQEQPLLLRSRQTGDEITLPSRSRKTVKKLLIDSKIPQNRRDRIAVMECGGKVAALDGFGADIAFLPQSGELCWKITSSKIEK